MNFAIRALRAALSTDGRALKSFFRAVYGETEQVASAYLNCALSTGKTYILDAGIDSPFIVSAVTVIERKDNVKFLAFGGTVMALRRRGFFREVLKFALDAEKGENGRFICFPPNEEMAVFLKEFGFVFPSYALECFLSGDARKKNKFHISNAGGCSIHYMREKHLGKDEFSDEAFFNSYAYFRAKGGYICVTGDGYIAYFPSEEKGKYKIAECAVSEKTLLSLPPAFESCILPVTRKERLKKAGIEYKIKMNALSTYDTGDSFIDATFRY